MTPVYEVGFIIGKELGKVGTGSDGSKGITTGKWALERQRNSF